MNRKLMIAVSTAIALLAVGCQASQNRAVEGGIIGGLLGGAAGGIIGHQSGHGGEGAAIGVAAGAVTGAIVGSQIPKQGQPQPVTTTSATTSAPTATPQTIQANQAANPNQMSLQQILDFTKQGVNENVIVDKIRLTNSKFNLSPSDVDSLKQQGVSQKVIDAMQGK